MTTPNDPFCQQKRIMQLYNVPLARFTPVNPYSSGQFTKMQLDMRRKAEVLEYNANKSSTQTNSLTKKEKFALLVRGGLSKTQAVTQSNKVTCPADDMILTPTTSSDVPGPVMYLYKDNNVPLYNYSEFNTRTYPDYVPDNLKPWNFVIQPDVLVYDNGSNNVYYLIITNSIDRPLYTYSIVMPVGFAVSGSIPPKYTPPSGSGFNGNISLQLNLATTLSIYYNDSLVTTVSPTTLSNFAIVINVPTANNTDSPLPFTVTQFIGNLTFQNIQLYTESTYVYTFVLNVDIGVVSTDISLVKYVALIANMSASVPSSYVGCSIVNLGQSATNAGTSISGV